METTISSTPYLNRSLLHPRVLSADKLPTLSLTPPHSTQAARDVRLQRKERVAALSLVPTAQRSVESSAPPLSCQMAQVLDKTTGISSALLFCSVLFCSPGNTSHNPCTTSAWEVIIAPRFCPGDKSWNKWPKQSSPCTQPFSAAVKNRSHTTFLSSLEGKVVMRKWTWKTNPTELGIVREPEGPFVPWTASPALCRQPVSTAMHMRPYCGSILRGLALTHGGSFP